MIDRPLYVDKIMAYVDTPFVKILTGVRRCGKSTILKMIMERLKTERNIPEDRIISCRFDSMEYEDMTAKQIYTLLKEKLSPAGKTYLFLDEVQEIKGWEKIVNSLASDFDVDLYITGSNSRMMSSEIATYPDIPAVYVDTGLEYPELRDFVKTKDNVIWLRPRYPFTQILEKYGYPIISKEVSDVINGARKGQPYRLARLNGELLDKNGKKSIYNCENYKYLLDAPFKISARCCYHMKKAPLNKFERQSGRHPITGVLACESKLREQSWIKFGCNGFERQRPLSQPLAFWLEEDILRYLKMTGIPYAPIYGDIVESRKKNGTPILKTTGVSRSGCMYCMYGVHLEHEPNRFQLMQVTHPQQYDYCINKLGCGAVLDYIGVPYRNQQLEVDHC